MRRFVPKILMAVTSASLVVAVAGFVAQPAGATAPVTLALGITGSNPVVVGTPVTVTGALAGGTPPFTTGSISLVLSTNANCSDPVATMQYPANPGTLGDATYDLAPTYTPEAPGPYYADGFFYGYDPSLVVANAPCQEIFAAVNQFPTTLSTSDSIALRMKSATITYSATLTNQTTGQGIGGQTISFNGSGSLPSCSGTTGGTGVATCTVVVAPWERALSRSPRYTATFAGTGEYDPSSATGHV